MEVTMDLDKETAEAAGHALVDALRASERSAMARWVRLHIESPVRGRTQVICNGADRQGFVPADKESYIQGLKFLAEAVTDALKLHER
jgi:hypothetical protein